MRKFVITVVACAAIGFMIGYLQFGSAGGEYIPIGELLSPPRGLFGEVTQRLRGIHHARRNVLLAGGVGAVVGMFAFGMRRR